MGHEFDVVDALVASRAVNFSQMQHLDFLDAVGLEVEHLGDDSSSGLTLDQAEPPARSEEILSVVELEANRIDMGRWSTRRSQAAHRSSTQPVSMLRQRQPRR